MERRAVVVHGLVQGVGFRPFVFNLATRLRLGGFVQNQTGTVVIEVEGEPPALDRFLTELGEHPPPLAQIADLAWEARPPQGEQAFRIAASTAGDTSAIVVAPDVATCRECLAEMNNPADRRFGYPFLNCTNCGPRLTIITGAPYDRPRTTMSGFPMCPACRAEYDDPRDRRFHAQPTACPVCGPRLTLLDSAQRGRPSAEPLADFAAALRAGRIGALKGLGGFHLACDASNGSAVAELRRRKHRDEKPFAVMVADSAAADCLAVVSPAERTLLQSPAAPIVLLRQRTPAGVVAAVAPGNPYLGVMLPYTPLHHLLLQALGGRPLVMTSGNRSDEPIAYQDDFGEKLTGIADLYLVHDRPIHVRCDDSVTRMVDGQELLLRRSRGYAPRPLTLPCATPVPLLAVGGQLKATFALARDRQAFLSHHLGDLDHYEAYRAFEQDVELYQQLFAIRPQAVVHDLHPDYATTRFARALAARAGSELLEVQHHHAHMASCMAENGLTEPVIGVTLDGTGYGTDGTVWGGEFLIGDYRRCARAGHFRPVGLPGGEQAIRAPWRMAVAYLRDAQLQFAQFRAQHLQDEMAVVERMLERGFNTPLTSSAGRLFDAVAALIGLRQQVSYEGQAAVELEWLALQATPDHAYPFALSMAPAAGEPVPPLLVDTRSLIRAVVDEVNQGEPPAVIARRFHTTLVEIIATVCGRLRQRTGLEAVVLSGGVFLNALLTAEATARLAADAFRVYRHRLVPPNDGGLSLGQLAVAAARLGRPAEGSIDVPRHSRQGDHHRA